MFCFLIENYVTFTFNHHVEVSTLFSLFDDDFFRLYQLGLAKLQNLTDNILVI